MAKPAAERLASVRSAVEQVCRLLQSPSADSLQRCAGILESAGAGLADTQPWLKHARGNPAALAEAHRLRETIRRSAHLLRVAQDYHATWTQSWETRSANYDPRGTPALPPRRGVVFLAG